MILENAVTQSCMKLGLYAIDKKMPTTKAEFESYRKMKKFQQHEAYPDPHVRDFIEAQLTLEYSSDQYNDFFNNYIPAMKIIKTKLEDGVKTLFDSKSKIYECLMLYEIVMETFNKSQMSKERLLKLFETMKNLDVKISLERIFNITKREIEVEPAIPVTDPRIFKKCRVKNGQMDPSDEAPESIKRCFRTTLCTFA